MNTTQPFGLNMAFNSGACTAAGAAATLTVAADVVATVKGVFTSVADEAKTLAAVTTDGVPSSDSTGYAATTFNTLYGGASTSADAPDDNNGQAAILVHCTTSGGVTKSIQGPSVQLDASGNLQNALQFPQIPDTLTPYCYQVLKAGLTSGDIVPGTSNWNSTGFTNSIVNVAVLPSKAYFA